MADVTESPRPNPLAHPTLGNADLCHVSGHAARGDGDYTALCGAPLPDEPRCCGTQPPCGRPRCPECSMRFHDITGKHPW